MLRRAAPSGGGGRGRGHDHPPAAIARTVPGEFKRLQRGRLGRQVDRGAIGAGIAGDRPGGAAREAVELQLDPVVTPFPAVDPPVPGAVRQAHDRSRAERRVKLGDPPGDGLAPRGRALRRPVDQRSRRMGRQRSGELDRPRPPRHGLPACALQPGLIVAVDIVIAQSIGPVAASRFALAPNAASGAETLAIAGGDGLGQQRHVRRHKLSGSESHLRTSGIAGQRIEVADGRQHPGHRSSFIGKAGQAGQGDVVAEWRAVRTEQIAEPDFSRIGHDLKAQRRDTVAEHAQLQILKHGIGGAAEGRAHGSFGRGDQRIDLLVAISAVEA